MKKSYILMIAASIAALFMILKAFLLNEDIKFFLLTFFAIGTGLALLRLFVNNSIKKMKGKSIRTKILFFAVLLGFGLPFQAWFRKNVLFSMDSSYLVETIAIMVIGLIFMTTFFGFVSEKRIKRNTVENHIAKIDYSKE